MIFEQCGTMNRYQENEYYHQSFSTDNYLVSEFFGQQNGYDFQNGGFFSRQEHDYPHDPSAWTLYNMDSCSVVRMDHSYINPTLFNR